MTENPNAFKHWFDAPLVRRIGSELAAHAAFDVESFVAECVPEIDALELKDRVRLITTALRNHLSDDYPTALAHILAVLPPSRATTDEVTQGFDLWPFCHFVEEYGLEHVDLSLAAMYELTQRFSAEFAVRPFLVRYPDEVLAQLAEWTGDSNPHVRRWISEGTRPRLPWGMRLQQFVDDPTPILPLLEALRHDREEYVRRSVANNLNDIAKDHPELVVEIAARWSEDANDDEQRMIKHALRTLVKQGHPGALELLGFGPAAIEVRSFSVEPPDVAVGEHVHITVELAARSDVDQSLLIDYAVHHQRANGSTSPKVFKWTTRVLATDGTLELRKKHSLKLVTTRSYYPGAHEVELLVNGESVATTRFQLRTST